MAAYVWAAASAGNWSVGANWQVGGVAQSVPPTSADSVTFGSGTGFTQSNCTVDTTANMLSISCTGYTGTLDFTGQTMSVAGSTVTFASGMTITGNSSSALNILGAGAVFTGVAKSYPGTVSFQGTGQARIIGASTYVNLTRTSSAVNTNSLALPAASTQTVTGTFTITGNSYVNYVTLKCFTAGQTCTLSAAAINITNTHVIDTAAAGTAAPFKVNSLGNEDLGNNSGWIFGSTVLNNYQFVKVGDGMSVSERIR